MGSLVVASVVAACGFSTSEACGNLSSRPGLNPYHLKCMVGSLTTGPTGKSQENLLEENLEVKMNSEMHLFSLTLGNGLETEDHPPGSRWAGLGQVILSLTSITWVKWEGHGSSLQVALPVK